MRKLAAAGTVALWASAFPAITVAVAGRGPAGGGLGGAGAGRTGAAGALARAPGAQARAAGPAADRGVRASRDDRVPAAAQRRGTGGAGRDGLAAGGHGA